MKAATSGRTGRLTLLSGAPLCNSVWFTVEQFCLVHRSSIQSGSSFNQFGQVHHSAIWSLHTALQFTAGGIYFEEVCTECVPLPHALLLLLLLL